MKPPPCGSDEQKAGEELGLGLAYPRGCGHDLRFGPANVGSALKQRRRQTNRHLGRRDRHRSGGQEFSAQGPRLLPEENAQAMDRSFDSTQFLKTAQDLFFKIQGAWNREDSNALRSLCGPELMRTWDEELAGLRARGQKNRMDNIALRESEVTEAWTESGIDYITVRFHANLLDFTVDEKSGAVVQGSNSEPIEFEEFWTFNRPVGPNTWKLTAVQQA